MDKVTATRVVTPTVGPEPMRVVCPSCQADIMTEVEHAANTKTHIYALLLCLAMCLPCVCIPYCCASCRDAVHRCPLCKSFIGVYRR
uniref:LITAF domain-containing protein n=1 Tax=Anopheles dirus TaxID=7168 RepID=A0A182NAP9_9DIPT